MTLLIFYMKTTTYVDDGGEDEDMAVVAFKNERIKEKEASERIFSKLVHFTASVFYINFGASIGNQFF